MFSHAIFKNPALPSTPPLRFPQKLWKIANECQTGAVYWSPDGKSILLRYSLFREEFMSTKSDFFKTDNISSFVRQLNLYGFRKVYDHAHKQTYKANPDLHEFSNTFFQRDRPDLLDKVTRKSGVLKDKNESWPENNKCLEYSDDSCEKLEIVDIASKGKDHCYLSSKTDETPPLLKNKGESKIVIRISQCTNEVKTPIKPLNENKENVATQVASNVSEKVADVTTLVKKKRGRKPGSKRNQTQITEQFSGRVRFFSVATLQNPEKYPDLIHFQDDDDPIFLRNTSKDVMLSSTLPFQETMEYRELKASYRRQEREKKVTSS